MKIKSNFQNLLWVLPLLFVLFSCNNSESKRPLGAYETGVLIINEGNFGINDGEVFHYDPVTETLKKNLFKTENERPFAGLLEDIVLEENRMYLVANTGKVEIVDPANFKSKGEVVGDLDQPRSLATASGKLFISDYGPYGANFTTPDSYIAVVDGLDGGVVKKKIPVSGQPEDLFVRGQYVLVASKEGKMEVIDAEKEELIKTLDVAGSPQVFFEYGGELWLYSVDAGKVYFLTISSDGLSIQEQKEIPVAMATGRMALDGNGQAYLVTSMPPGYENNSISVVNFEKGEVSVSSWKNGTGFYGIGYDRNRQEVYVADSKGFQGNGEVIIYDKDGAEVNSIEVGRGPSGFLFR